MDFIFQLKLFSVTRTITINRQWFQFWVIALVLITSSVISFWGGAKAFVLLVVLLVGIAGTIVLIQRPNLGFILLFLGGMFVHFVGPSGLNAVPVTVAFLLGLWIMDMFVVKRQFTFIRSSTMLPILIFLAVSLLALGMGQVPWYVFARQAPLTAQLGGFSIFVFSIGVILLAAHRIKDLRWLQIIVWSFLILSAGYVLGRAVRLPFIDLIYSLGFTAQSMFWTWLVALAAGQLIYNDQLQKRTRVLLFGLLLLTFYVAVVQAFDWKSGWLPPLVALLVLLGNRYRQLVAFAIPIVAIAGVYVTFSLIATDDYSWGTRLDAWRIILEISKVSPILGMGFSNYYWYTPLFPIRGWRVSFNSHSQFVDLIAQTGYLGLFCYVWLLFAVGRLSFHLGAKLSNGFARGYAQAVFAGVVGTLVSSFLVDWVLPFVYNIGLTGFRASILPWIFMGGLIALEQMYLQDSNL
jgi:hypothetical protein